MSKTDIGVLSGTVFTKCSRCPHYIAACGSCNRRVPVIYLRNGCYYVRLWVDRGNGTKTARRFPLVYENDDPVIPLAANRSYIH